MGHSQEGDSPRDRRGEAPEDGERPSLEDEIFAVASTVEVETGRAEPLLGEPLTRLRRNRFQAPPPREIGLIAGGFLTFAFVDAVMMYAPLMSSSRPSLLPQMVTLLVLAFGLGGLLAVKVRGSWRPFGVGMMLGWVFLTLVSVGFLTGLTSL
ncbi:hypothetical protein GCM10023085_10250 [Actinomadura viridis]|uniref:Uncharacterized protein n=1 Tax=Actinomadura viridis TaxID=58110 RepID=A0A931DQP0_9ACTN|nr:hypothetical protein [Actinomadura viridis]MBG6092036.1 hypothetical protein [Actinomadura viridis]